jgi:hypothetical protein
MVKDLLLSASPTTRWSPVPIPSEQDGRYNESQGGVKLHQFDSRVVLVSTRASTTYSEEVQVYRLIIGKPDGSRCYIAARAEYVELLTVKVQGWPKPMPMVKVAYDLDTLQILAPLFGAMKNHGTISPQLHIWDRTKPQPEVAVLFRYQNPSAELLRSIGAVPGCKEIITTGEARVDRAGVKLFLREYRKRAAGALVMISEVSAADEVDPVYVSLITRLYAQKPQLE